MLDIIEKTKSYIRHLGGLTKIINKISGVNDVWTFNDRWFLNGQRFQNCTCFPTQSCESRRFCFINVDDIVRVLKRCQIFGTCFLLFFVNKVALNATHAPFFLDSPLQHLQHNKTRSLLRQGTDALEVL